MNSERELFESQEFIKRLLRYSKFDEKRNEYIYSCFENYAIRDTCELNTAWEAWQASAQRQGYKLVPVEPTKEMIEIGNKKMSAYYAYKAMIGVVDEQ